MKIGLLFPGQGSQYVGMGLDIYEKYNEAKEIYNKVSKISNRDIKKISFEGPEEILSKTQNTQLSILTESLAILEILKKYNIRSQMSAGLSLGEYTALIEDGILDFETGVSIVAKRGEIMQNLTPKGNWQMVAIIGLEAKQVENICQNITCGFAVPANYNTNEQIVVSGEENAVQEVANQAKSIGAKKVIILKTAGPFHTKKLTKCSETLKAELKNSKIHLKNSKVAKNIDGKLYNENDNIVEILSKHIISPVKFTQCLETMYKNGIDCFIEIGPRKNIKWFCEANEI